ncbi:MAG: 2-amino-4-hydroxy-6-hydroxymethyldihydropteridine diphosphokinase [Micropruina sp.]
MNDPNAHLDFDLDTMAGLKPLRSVVFSVGSNLGDRLAFLQGAVNAIASTPELRLVEVSSVYETAPVGMVLEQPDFLNIVVLAESTLASMVLLERALAIENAFRRVREVPGGPRTLDVDLIAVGRRTRNRPELTLPHPRAHERAFVLIPWLEVQPDADLPGLGPIVDLLGLVDLSGVRQRPDLVLDLP